MTVEIQNDRRGKRKNIYGESEGDGGRGKIGDLTVRGKL